MSLYQLTGEPINQWLSSSLSLIHQGTSSPSLFSLSWDEIHLDIYWSCNINHTLLKYSVTSSKSIFFADITFGSVLHKDVLMSLYLSNPTHTCSPLPKKEFWLLLELIVKLIHEKHQIFYDTTFHDFTIRLFNLTSSGQNIRIHQTSIYKMYS